MGNNHDYDHIWSEVYGDMQDRGPVHRHMRRLIGRSLAEIEYSDAMDVGCGMGHNLPLLSTNCDISKISGVDISSVAIDHMQKRWGDRFSQLDIEKQPVDGQWDLVFCSLLLEHVADDMAVIRNLRKMARKYIFAVTIAGNYKRYERWEQQMGHLRNYGVGELEEKMSKAGCEIAKATYWGFPFFSPVARTLQNFGNSKKQFGLGAKIAARILYYLYFLNSSKRGDLLIVVAKTH